MSNRRLVAILAAGAALLGTSAATAKDFQPGDMLVCDAQRCRPIMHRSVVPLLGAFYYSGPQPGRAPRVRLGAPAFQLRFANGYVTGIVASTQLDRFLSYGVYLGRFRRGVWYRVPARLAAELQKLTAELEPLRVTPRLLSRSR
jgi:hypothetical protein